MTIATMISRLFNECAMHSGVLKCGIYGGDNTIIVWRVSTDGDNVKMLVAGSITINDNHLECSINNNLTILKTQNDLSDPECISTMAQWFLNAVK